MREIWKAVKNNVTTSLTHLDKSVDRTNRELVYGAIACAAVGMVIGMLVSPKKNMSICSDNGNHNGPHLTPTEETVESSEEE